MTLNEETFLGSLNLRSFSETNYSLPRHNYTPLWVWFPIEPDWMYRAFQVA